MNAQQRTYLRRLVESTETVVLRPKDWRATSDEGRAYLSRLRELGFVFRGMTNAEFQATVAKDGMVRSNKAFSHFSEGTSFSNDPEDAESYVNFGRDDPRVTNQPNWLVKVKLHTSMYKDRDGYVKSREPVPVFEYWKMWAEAGSILIQYMGLHPQMEAFETTFEANRRGFATQIVDIYKDPTVAELARIAGSPSREVNMRALIDRTHVYGWPSFQAVHAQAVLHVPRGQPYYLKAYLRFPNPRSKEVFLQTDESGDHSWVASHPYFVARKLKVHLPEFVPEIELSPDDED